MRKNAIIASLPLPLVLLFTIFFLYSNTLDGPFVFDDEANIARNPHLRLEGLSLEGLKKAGLNSVNDRRPVANISFAVNFMLHGERVFGYHLINILVHAVNAILLFFFVKNTLLLLHGQASGRKPEASIGHSAPRSILYVSFCAALLWAVHPLQTQSVSYIVQRMNSMAAMFYLISFLFYIQARRSETLRAKGGLFAGCVVSGLLALGSKEIAATLPFFILLYEWFFFQGLDSAWLKRRLPALAVVAILMVGTGLLFLGSDPVGKLAAGFGNRDFTAGQRVLTQGRVVAFYLSLLVLPHPGRLNLDHDVAVSQSFWSPPTTLLSFAAIAGLLLLAVFMARRNRLISFSIFWFFGNLAIESSVIPLEMIFEHRTYLPSMMLIPALVVVVYRLASVGSVRIAVFGVAAAVLCFWTWERNTVWANPVALWSDCAKKSPAKARPRANLGRVLAEKGRTAEARVQLAEALRLDPESAVAHLNMGTLLERKGRYDEAIRHFSEAVRLSPGFANAHYNLGVAHHRKGRIDLAARQYREAIAATPYHALAHNNLGVALQTKGRLDEAAFHYRKALSLHPEYIDARRNLQGVESTLNRGAGNRGE